MSHAIEAFFAAWGDPDAESRAATLRTCLSPEIAYLDPRLTDPLKGVEAVIDYVAMYTQYAPGATAEVIRTARTGQNVRASVAFRMGDGAEQHGQYMIEVDEAERPTRMVGVAGLGEAV